MQKLIYLFLFFIFVSPIQAINDRSIVSKNIKDILLDISDKIESLEKTELEELKFYNYEELFDYYALIALIFMFSGFLLQYTLLKSIA